MKIADRRPGRNETLMAMGHGSTSRGLGAWTVSAGPALELRSEDTGSRQPGRVYHWVPTARGNERRTRIQPQWRGGLHRIRHSHYMKLLAILESEGFQKPSKPPPENLWVYGFYQSPSSNVN